MKKYYVFFLLFIFFSYKINAQNWQAISPQHIYNYQVNADINPFYNTKINTMVNVFVDSITVINGNTTQYALNTVFDREMPENGQYQLIHQPQFLQKEMWVQNDTFLFQNPAATKMILTQAQIGQSWLFDAAQNITANVVDIQATTTFGQADSIKIIVLSTNDSLILSKEFGIIRFPFAYNSPYFYQLVGINDLHLGVTVPMFEDIFNFEVGDMFEYFKHTAHVGDQVFETLKYEIISKNYTNGMFNYGVVGNRVKQVIINMVPSSGVITYHIIQDTYIYKDTLFERNISKYNYQPYPFNRADLNPPDFIANTQISDTSLLGYPTIFKRSERYANDCNTFQMSDTLCQIGQTSYKDRFTVAKGLGYISYLQGFAYTYISLTLKAFRKNGITYGTFTPDSLLIAGIENSKNASFYQVFPNPTTANITLLFDKEDNYKIAIYNILGEKMSNFSIQNKKEEVIDLQNFVSGMYYVQVVDTKGKRSVQKIVKQ